jgi:hypothetical protein
MDRLHSRYWQGVSMWCAPPHSGRCKSFPRTAVSTPPVLQPASFFASKARGSAQLNSAIRTSLSGTGQIEARSVRRQGAADGPATRHRSGESQPAGRRSRSGRHRGLQPPLEAKMIVPEINLLLYAPTGKRVRDRRARRSEQSQRHHFTTRLISASDTHGVRIDTARRAVGAQYNASPASVRSSAPFTPTAMED